MADKAMLTWGNIVVEFDTAVFGETDIADAVGAVEARLPGFADRVPAGSLISLSRHSYSGDYVGDYQVGSGRPREVAKRAWTARRAARKLLDEIASHVSADISALRPRGTDR